MTPRTCFDPHPVWLATALLLSAPIAALAQPGTLDYDLPAASMATTLNAIAQRSGVAVSTPAELVSGRLAAPVRGRFTASQAFEAALASTGLQAVRGADGSYVLQSRLAGGSVSSSALTLAPEAGNSPEQARALPVVTVTAEHERGFTNTATAQTLDRSQLDRIPPTSTGDIFKDVPGVTVANNRNGPAVDLNIRGSQGMGRVKILVDGTQSGSSAWKGYAGNVDNTFFDPDLVSGLTVEKGPSSGPYGAGAVGGVVQLQSLAAHDILLPGQNKGVRLRGMLGNNSGPSLHNYNDNLHASGAATPYTMKSANGHQAGSIAGAWIGVDGKLELVGAYSQRQQGNYHAGTKGKATYLYGVGAAAVEQDLAMYKPGEQIYNTSTDTQSLLLKGRILLPHDQSLALTINDYSSEYGEVRSAFLAPGSTGLNSWYSQYKRQQGLGQTDKTTYTVNYAWQPQGDFWNLQANLWQADVEEVRKTGYAISKVKSQGMELWNTTTLRSPWTDLRLRYGTTWFAETSAIQDLAHIPVTGQLPLVGGPQSGSWMDFPGKRQIWSQFLQAEASPAPWMAVQAGLRRESYRVTGTGTYPSSIPGQNPVPFDLRHEDSQLNPSAGVTLSPWAGVELFARYSEGWRPPTIKETMFNPRELLRPERTKSKEVGVNLSFDRLLTDKDTVRVNASRFDNRHKDYIFGVFDPVNIEGARLKGTELSFNYDAGHFFVQVGMTRYDKIEFCGVPENGLAANPQPCSNSLPIQSIGSGSTMVGIHVPPKWSRSATIGARMFDRRLTLGMRLHAVGERGATQLYPAGINYSRQGWAPYEIYDLFGNYRVNQQLDLNFSVENVADRFYIDALTNSSFVIPSPGRTAKVTLTYKF